MRGHSPILSVALALGTFLCGCQEASRVQGRKILYYQDPMHPSYRSDRPGIAPDCQMELTPVFADSNPHEPNPGEPAVVQITSAQEAAIGLRVEAARADTGFAEIRTIGRVQAQESRIHQVSAGADGWIRHV